MIIRKKRSHRKKRVKEKLDESKLVTIMLDSRTQVTVRKDKFEQMKAKFKNNLYGSINGTNPFKAPL